MRTLHSMSELDIREKVRLLPHQPGVYQFLDFSGRIIYIGKAKSLRNRVSSYFAKRHDSGKTAKLVAINVPRTSAFAFALGGALTAAAGSLLSTFYTFNASMGSAPDTNARPVCAAP